MRQVPAGMLVYERALWDTYVNRKRCGLLDSWNSRSKGGPAGCVLLSPKSNGRGTGEPPLESDEEAFSLASRLSAQKLLC